MPESELLLEEIIKMIDKIEASIIGRTLDDFSNDINLLDATLMRLHFIGENVNSISYELTKKNKKVRWKKFARLRNIIGHKYSIVNREIIWDVIKKSLPQFKEDINNILKESKTAASP